MKTPGRCQWSRSGVFIVNFEHIPRIVLMSLLLTSNVSIVNFEEANADWVSAFKREKV